MSQVRFEVAGSNDANSDQLAQSLQRGLRELGPSVTASRMKADQDTLELGSVVIAALASPLLAEAAKFVFSLLANKTSRSIKVTRTIEREGRRVVEETELRGLSEEEIKEQLRKATSDPD